MSARDPMKALVRKYDAAVVAGGGASIFKIKGGKLGKRGEGGSMMFDWNKIVDWKLLQGSHDFPGPDGGTCINEAAIVAAGFEYKKIESAADCPPCFSRPIAAYAIRLNDRMPGDLRQQLLMPFVVRLAGTTDTAEIEQKRTTFLVIETVRRIISKVCLDVLRRPDIAEQCKRGNDLTSARIAANAAADAAYAANAAYAAAYAAANAAYAAAKAAAYAAAKAAAYAAADAAANAADAADNAKIDYFSLCVGILNEAILLGNHPVVEDVDLVRERMFKFKELATT